MDSLTLVRNVKDLSGSLPLKSESIFARGRVESRLGLPFLGQGYLDARGSGIYLEELSFLEILLDRRVSASARESCGFSETCASPQA